MKKDNDSNKSCKVDEKLLSIDKFGQSFAMRLEEGRNALPSRIGALCSIIFVITLLSYAGYKIWILEGRKNVNILQAVKEDHFADTYTFSSK